MKALGLAGLWLATVGIALTGGWSVMYQVSYVVLLLVAVCWLWAWVGGRSLRVERRTRTQRAQVGGTFEERIAVENTSWVPKPWVEVRSPSNLAGHSLRYGFFLGPKAYRAWTFRTQCVVRGKFTLGDMFCTTGDPFGLFQRRARFSSEATVIVYPRTVDLLGAGGIPGQLPGGGRQSGHVPFVTPTAAGIREYQPSDPYQRIHWPSTARTGRLMVKEFELDPFADVWVVLDLDWHVHVGSGPESTEEYAVTATASLMRYFLLQNRSVGLAGQRELLLPDRGPRQVSKVLELLALVRAERPEALAETLAEGGVRFNRLTTVCIVTPSVDTSWVTAAQELIHRSVKVLAVVVESSTFGGGRSSVGIVGALAAAGIPVYLVKRGEPLEGLLAQRQVVGGGDGRWQAPHAP